MGGLRSSELIKNLPVKDAIVGDYLQIIYDAIVEEGTVDYISLGPLTNLSALIRRFPDVVERINRVITMGGGIGLGNVTEFAEFNFYCDAESADHVLSVMPDVLLAPIDITTQINFSLPAIASIGAADTVMARAMEAMLKVNYDQCVDYGEPGATMHDSTAILGYLYPELFEFRACGVRVDCEKERYGESVAHDGNNNIRLMTGAQAEQLLDIIARCITEFNAIKED
jgi:inosine-uridine nucleoside N-ribohydrolase